jgi:antitoxin (DNA-binding transcriptional repressor) of toxin-antitoxin stability system
MTTVSVAEAQASLPVLLDRLMAGEEVLITQDDAPVARLVPMAPHTSGLPQLGLLAGQVWVADDFDDALPDEMLAAFNGECP